MRRNNLVLWCFGVLVLLCLGALVLQGCFRKEVKNLDSKGKNIICFGDSITFGYGVKPGEDYPTALGKLTDIPVINAGVDGDTSTMALKRLDSDVLSKGPLLVLVEFGGNDFIKKVPKEETLKSVSEIIDRIHAGGAMVAVVDISAGFFMSEYRAILSRLAQKKQAIFIPELLKGIITNPSMKSDFLHPNVNGYRIVASRVYKTIGAYLKPASGSAEH